MKSRINYIIVILTFAFVLTGCKRQGPDTAKTPEYRSAYVDDEGIIRWSDNNKEVALFGVNYILPSASDYRAAGYITNDRKKVIEQDMAHFARMGWNGLRLAFWGDWENSDSLGNLVVNDHLDLMDYLILKARERGIYMLLTPIQTYSSMWPDKQGDTTADGFSKYYSRSELGTNPEAIAVQVNYLKEMMNHVNPYTGTALKDEPSILFIEMINEPDHHSEDTTGSVDYINKLVDAIRSTGCDKILFHNYSQDARIGYALKESEVQGVSFAWYPSGLVSGRTLKGNYLRTVDDFPPMSNPEISKMPRLVYEFDSPDMYNGYMYPAMMRTFRSAGAQFVAMFSYDMMVTAPYNLGWQTHFLNMVYTPGKSVSAVIAAEVMKNIPLWETYGNYPENTLFGPFRVSYEENLSEMVTADKFMYSNSTGTDHPQPDSLVKIVGYGSSPLVRYEGKGIYFLDKIMNGIWRLEVYPDAMIVSDPFERPGKDKVVSRLLYREWSMVIKLPDLGDEFKAFGINKGNTYYTAADSGKFDIYPGVYILYKDKPPKKTDLPEYLGKIGLDEFICNEAEKLPLQVNLVAYDEYLVNQPVGIKAEIIDNKPPDEVMLHIRGKGNRNRWFQTFNMEHKEGYTYSVSIDTGKLGEGWFEYAITVKTNDSLITFPSAVKGSPVIYGFTGSNFWKAKIVSLQTPMSLLDPEKDINKLAFTRIGDAIRFGIFEMKSSNVNGQAVYRLYLPLSFDRELDDYTMSLTVKDRIDSRKAAIRKAKSLRISARGSTNRLEAFVTLVEADGTSWSKKIILSKDWNDIVVPVNELGLSRGVKLPQGFPQRWNYWIEPAEGRGGPGDSVQMDKVERLQISLRPSGNGVPETNPWIEIGAVVLIF
jgi:hypothetical protein